MTMKMKEGGCGANMKHGNNEPPPYTPGGKLTKAGVDMLKQMLQPKPVPLKKDDRRHAFIMVGNKTLFLVHMTMFHMEEHCYQIVLRARLPASIMKRFREWRRKNPKQAYFLANLAESAMDIPQIACGQVTSFEAEIFAGIPPKKEYTEWPWGDVQPVARRVRVHVERVVYYRHFDYNFDYPHNLTYVLFGAGNEAHMQSYQTKEPDFDHVLTLAAAPSWLPKNKLESAVTVNFPSLRSRPVHLKNPLTRKQYQVQYQGFWTYLGAQFTKLHPLKIGTTWWFHTSPVNLVPPWLHKGGGKR